MSPRSLFELRGVCAAAGLSQHALGCLIDANLPVRDLVRSEAAAMANAKRAGLTMEERGKLREALRRHSETVLSAEEPAIVDIDDDAEAHAMVAAQLALARERRANRAKGESNGNGGNGRHGGGGGGGDIVVRNGNVLERYRWTQELNELTLAVALPPGTRKHEVVCKIGVQSLRIGVRGADPIVDGTLHARIDVDSAIWQLQDSHKLIVNMQKLGVDKQAWWPCLLKGEPEINTMKCEVGESTNLLSTDGEKRYRVEKIELPEMKDGKKLTPEEAEAAWKEFFIKFPDWHAYELSIDANGTVKKDGTEMTIEEALVEKLSKNVDASAAEWEKPTS